MGLISLVGISMKLVFIMQIRNTLLVVLTLGTFMTCTKPSQVPPDGNIEDEVGSLAHTLKFSTEQAATAFVRQDGSLWIMGEKDLTGTGVTKDVLKPRQ